MQNKNKEYWYIPNKGDLNIDIVVITFSISKSYEHFEL